MPPAESSTAMLNRVHPPLPAAPLLVPSLHEAALNRLKILVLNADMTAMGTTPRHLTWAEAVTLVVTERVTPLITSDLEAHSARTTVRVPLVVMAKRFERKAMLAELAYFNRWHLYLRDGGTCQYTGRPLVLKSTDPARQATVDHVIPRVRGGSNTWENCVLAASAINSHKGSKLPHEAGLTLRTTPKAPRVIDLQAAWYRLHRQNPQAVPPVWAEFLEPIYRQWKVAA
jgi:5-methylcytosine-specific restriction endonuclease McrA